MKILVAYNGSDVAKKALDLAKDYAKTYDAMVYIITSMEGGSREKLKAISKSKEDLEYQEAIKADAEEKERQKEAGEDGLSLLRAKRAKWATEDNGGRPVLRLAGGAP